MSGAAIRTTRHFCRYPPYHSIVSCGKGMTPESQDTSQSRLLVTPVPAAPSVGQATSALTGALRQRAGSEDAPGNNLMIRSHSACSTN